MNVDVSPDGQTLVFDLLGDIYWLPLAGGEAVALTTGRAWDQVPRFAPDGQSVYFVSDRIGHKNVWRLALSDLSLRQVTRSDFNITGRLNWSQDRSHLLVGLADALNLEFILQFVSPDTGKMMPIDAPSEPWIDMDTYEVLRSPINIFAAAQSADGDIFFSKFRNEEESGQSATVTLSAYNVNTQSRTEITPVNAPYSEYNPHISHSGDRLAYYRQYSDRRTQIRIRNLATEQDDVLIELANADDAHYYAREDTAPSYAFTPDDRELIFWHGGKIHRVRLADGSDRIIPFRVSVKRKVVVRAQPTVKHFDEIGQANIIRWPSLSRDGKTMAFSAIGYVWVMDLKTGAARRLTRSDDLEFMPALSPDGQSVAYVSFSQSDNDYGSGRLMVAHLGSGTPQAILSNPNETYFVPKWSNDSSMIALIREVKTDGKVNATFGWTATVDGRFNEVAPGPASGDAISWFIYSRFVGFDETDRHLLFSFPRSRNETVLAKTTLDGGPLRTLAIGTPEVGGITPAPDLNNLALTRRDGTVWVAPFAVGGRQSTVSTLASNARRVSADGGYYVDWNGPDQVTFGFAKNVYRHELRRRRSEALHVKLTFAKPKALQPIAFKGARLVTISGDCGAGPVIESGTIVLDKQRIVSVGSASEVSIPADALVIDGTGKTIVPGFLDTHYHRIGGSGISAFRLPNAGISKFRKFGDRSAIVYGVTSAWEPGGPLDDGVPATVDLQAAGRIAGPRWSHSAQGTIGYPWELLTSYSAALASVEQHRKLGVDVLKEYNTPTRRQQQWLLAAAREKGMGIVSHLQSFNGTMTRIVDGYTGGDHPKLPTPFYKDVHELLQQTGYLWTPNIVITAGTVAGEQGKADYFCVAALAWHNRTNRKVRKFDSICPPDRFSSRVPYDIPRFSRVARQAASAASNGARVGVSAHDMPASLLHLEMWYLWKGGLPIADVLRAATIGNAEKLGLQEEVGSLEPGKIADFLVLDENPLDDILNTLSLKYTVQGGVVYDSSTALPADLNSIRETEVDTPHHVK